MVLAAALSLVSPRLLRRSGSFARYIGTLASWQAFMLVPLASLAFAWPFLKPLVEARSLEWLVAAAVFLLITLYFFGALASAAPWMTSTGALIPARIRARYAAQPDTSLEDVFIQFMSRARDNMAEGDDR